MKPFRGRKLNIEKVEKTEISKKIRNRMIAENHEDERELIVEDLW